MRKSMKSFIFYEYEKESQIPLTYDEKFYTNTMAKEKLRKSQEFPMILTVNSLGKERKSQIFLVYLTLVSQ